MHDFPLIANSPSWDERGRGTLNPTSYSSGWPFHGPASAAQAWGGRRAAAGPAQGKWTCVPLERAGGTPQVKDTGHKGTESIDICCPV